MPLPPPLSNGERSTLAAHSELLNGNSMHNLKHQVQHVHALHRILHPCRNANFALIVLNQPLDFPIPFLEQLWLHATWRVCADGGANRLFDALNGNTLLQGRLLPHFIAGDLDSIRSDVSEFYRSRGTLILPSDCQNSTDFEKCLVALMNVEAKEVTSSEMATSGDISNLSLLIKANPGEGAIFPPCISKDPMDIVVIGGTGGRFDQMMGIVHTLLRVGELHLHRRVWLLSPECAITTLGKGTHRIDVVDSFEGPECGLLPIGNSCVVSSHGLKWDLDRSTLSFGLNGLVSSSNILNWNPTPVVPEHWLSRESIFAATPDSPGGISKIFSRSTPVALAISAEGTTQHGEVAQIRDVRMESSAKALAPSRIRRESIPTIRAGERMGHVFVETSEPIIWTVSLNLKKKLHF
jgi:thiamine pyrophosphokinase